MGTQPTFDGQVSVAIIASIAGIITTWLTVKYKNRVIKRVTSNRPKDRMETIFDGYEKLILQQQQEINRKQDVISSLESIISNLERELATTKGLLATTKDEVAETKHQNTELKHHLALMRKEYDPQKLENR